MEPLDRKTVENDEDLGMQEAEDLRDSEDFESMLEDQGLYDESFKEIRSGQIIMGRVVSVKQDEVIIDIGAKCEGAIPLADFLTDEKDQNVYIGKEFEVFIIKREDKDGAPVLSRKRAREIVTRQNVRRAYETGDPVECKIIKVVKGGLQVECGVTGFMPFSHTGIRRGQQDELEEMVGKNYLAKVIELRGRQDAVLSRRVFLEEDRDRKKIETMAKLQVGALIKGVVKNLTEFGAFIDLGGIDGLLHLNDMSWQHVTRPEEVVSVGLEIETLVTAIDGERISLSLKNRTSDPWIGAEEKYTPGATVSGEVTSLTKYGAFVEIEPGVEGLIHISEMSWTHRVKHPSEMFKTGEHVSAQILKVDLDNRRISLSYKQARENPWDMVDVKYPKQSVVEGTVVGLTDFGAFVRLEDGVDGMIHVSDMSWTRKIKHPSEILTVGDPIQALVREVDKAGKRISLSLKEVEPDPWSRVKKKYRVGNHVEGTIVKVADFGLFVELEEGIEGLIHVSELSESRVEHPEQMFKEGDKISAKVIKCDWKNHKIGLSLKEFHQDVERQEVQKYMGADEESLGTMGDLLSSALRDYDKKVQDANSEAEDADQDSEEDEG